MKKSKVFAIILAGGSGARFGGETPKQYVEVAGKPLLAHCLQSFEEALNIDEVILVVSADWKDFTQENVVNRFDFKKVTNIVNGGKTRVDSTCNGLAAVPSSVEIIAIHDAARALVDPSDIDNIVNAAIEHHAALLVAPVTDTIKQVSKNKVTKTINRSNLYRAETPQVFSAELIRRAHQKIRESESLVPTDDAQAVEILGEKVHALESNFPNPKITRPEDLLIAEALIHSRSRETSK